MPDKIKVLLDNNLPRRPNALHFLELIHCSRFKLERSDDVEIFNFCKLENIECLITKDKDFEELVFMLSPPPRIIHLTCGNLHKNDLNIFLENH
jgi:predicted nuclease of predicted toxin-antitoxin system